MYTFTCPPSAALTTSSHELNPGAVSANTNFEKNKLINVKVRNLSLIFIFPPNI